TGLSVILHNWSGMSMMANDKYNWPIGSGKLIKAPAKFYPEEYGDIGDWRDPDEVHLKKMMRYLYERRDEAKKKGELAARWTREAWDWDTPVRKMWMDMNGKKSMVWGEFYSGDTLTKNNVQDSVNSHKEFFWILKGFYPRKVIEAGCGTGEMSGWLTWKEQKIHGVEINSHMPDRVIAIDNDERVLKYAKTNLVAIDGASVELVNADAFEYQEKADLVFSQGMLEHLTDDEMRRLTDHQLQQAPIVIHSVPNNDYGKRDFGNERLLTDVQYRQIFSGYDMTLYRYWLENGVRRQTVLVFKRDDGSFPKVSIIMPVFNNLEYTKKAIAAIGRHTKGYELIVIDNGSTDGTKEWLDERQEIRVLHLPENLGVPGAKNLGLALAKGEYICFLDNDTEAGPGWLEQFLDAFKDPTVGFAGKDGYLINKTNGWFMGEERKNGELVEWCSHSVFMFPRRLLFEIGLLIDKDLWCAEDIDQCCKIRQLGYKGKIPDNGVNVDHIGSVTAKNMTLAKTTKFGEMCVELWNEWSNFVKTRDLGSRVDIGVGDNPRFGYVHIDAQPIRDVDIVAMADRLPCPDNSIGEIFSSHLVEHFTKEKLDDVLDEWYRVLDFDGTLIILCPDFVKVCSEVASGKISVTQGLLWTYGGQKDKFDLHYWAYTFESLKEKLEKHGFVNVIQESDPDGWLRVKAKRNREPNVVKKKISTTKSSLRVLFKGTHHHIYGGGENMTFAMLKIFDELYPDLEVDIGKSEVDPKNAFGLDLRAFKNKSDRENDLFVNVSHWDLPELQAKKNIAVIFYPQYDWAEKIQKYDKVVTISDFCAKEIRRKWGVQAEVIPPAVDVGKFRIGEKKNQILSVGRFFRVNDGNNKNQHILVQAFMSMPKDWKLILVGSVQDEAYYDTVRMMAKDLNVEFLHNVSFDQLVRLYSESKFYWSATGYGARYPSCQEHFGIVAVEALASGCRTLVYDGGGMAEINGVDRWRTIDELVGKTKSLVEYDAQELKRGVERYSFDSVKEQWRQLIDNLMEE
ncbi:MAG: glycosyltransferase, partial [Candidatus Nanoarchaeia archaeon]